jgi:hypothetical protein
MMSFWASWWGGWFTGCGVGITMMLISWLIQNYINRDEK